MSRRANGLWLLGLLGLLVGAGATRLALLAADPPYWMPDAFMADAGWWANGARGRVLFGNYFSEDFGMGYLVTPAYTWALQGAYHLWGVSLVHAEIVAALSNLLVIGVVALVVWRCVGPRESLVAAALLGISPYFWGYGRVALPESPQLLLVVGSFALWLLARHAPLGAVASGLAMAAAIAVKPNAAAHGLVPVSLAALAGHLSGTGSEPDARARERRRFLREAGLALAGLGAGLALLLVVLVVPHWEDFRKLMVSESGAGEIGLRDVLAFPSFALMSVDYDPNGAPSPILWRLAHWSPAIAAGAWIYLLSFVLGLRPDRAESARSTGGFEMAVVVWAIATALSLFTSARQWDYRQPALLPPLAILASLWATRARAPAGDGGGGRIFALLLWGVLLLPAVVLLKPIATRATMGVAAGLSLGRTSGLELDSAGMPFVAAWVALLVVASRFRRTGVRLATRVASPGARGVLLILLAFECWTIGDYFGHVEHTLVTRQTELARYVEDGQTVAGRMSATLFHPLRVRTVRRVAPDASPDVFDFDQVWHRYQPRYVVAVRRFDFVLYQPFAPLDRRLAEKGYTEIFRFDVGPRRAGVPRFEFALYRSTEASHV